MSSGSYCLIGGTGFLGTALRRRLRDLGRPVVVVGRASNTSLDPGERYVRDSDLERFVRDGGSEHFEAVVDLAYATVPSTSAVDPVADVTVNLRAVLNHLDAARSLNARRYAFISSGGTIYGDSNGEPIPETAPQRPISPYGISKLACEHYAMMMHRRGELSAVILRPSNVYGPGQRPFRGQGLIATALASALQGQQLAVFGDGSQVRDFLFVDDFCDGLMAAIAHGEAGETFNLATGQGLTIRNVLEQVSGLVARDGYRLDLEWRAGRPFDVRHNVLDVTKLSQSSGWRPGTAFADGLRRTWEWIKQQPWRDGQQ